MSRGIYGNNKAVIGVSFVDRLKLKRLVEDFDETHRSLGSQAKTRADWQGYFDVAIEPVWLKWNIFRQSAGESIDAASYDLWSRKLDLIRGGAKAFGMKPSASLVTMGLVAGGAVLLIGAIVIASSRGRS